jgi:transposase InsO family protein
MIHSLIDTGASCSLIKESVARKLGCYLSPVSIFINGIGQNQIHIFAMISVVVKFDDVCIELDIHVARDCDVRYDLLIGRNAVKYPDIEIVTDLSGSRLVRKPVSTKTEVNLATSASDLSELTSRLEHLDDNLQEQVKQMFQKYPSVLAETGTVKTGELNLRLKRNDIVHYRPYRLAPIEREKVDQLIQELLNNGIIRESDSPFASPVILVKKKDGSDRLCIDYRALNKILEKDRYPLPLIEDQIDRLGKAKYFISIDMKNGFYQIPVSKDSTKYTAFVTPNGHYEFVKMPFGICNGPAVFQRAITKAVQHLKFLLVYIDDILIPFSTIEEGLSYLDETLKALSSAGFTVNLKKCKFFVDSIDYLGRRISSEGIRPSETKVDALINSPVPRNVKQVRQFMGLASYFRKFIPNFAARTACITKLTKANQKWEWGMEQDVARNYVIEHLSSNPLLTVFDPKLPTELYTDASSIGYGAILIQKANNNKNVVAYFSRRTTPTESRYCSYDLETLAIYSALKHFRVYLLGIQFQIITDCNSIKSTMNKRDLSPRVARWWTFMQDFDFEITYKRGKYIGHVDFLSRNPVPNPVSVNTPHTMSSTIGRQQPQCDAQDVTGYVNLIDEPESWLQTAQQNESETQNLISLVLSGDLDASRYLLRENLLYYCIQPDQPKLYVPKRCRFNLLRLFHDDNCHVGFDKTLGKLREHFWFPQMSAFVKKYLKHCLTCVERKGPSGPKQGFLHPISKTPVPFHTVHLDCTGPFPRTNEGYRYILLLVDGFTKFCLLKPLKSLKSQDLMPLIREIVTTLSTPSKVITDQGTNFSSQQIRSLFRDLHIEHHMIATGSPRGNGQVERYVATVINMLNSTCNGSSDWPSALWKVQQSANTTLQKSTGFTPVRLLIGCNANIPSIQARLNDINVSELNTDVRADRELAHQRLCLEAQKFKSRFDNVRRDNQLYQVGNTVYVNQDHRRCDKLSPRYKGPYEITALEPNDRYALRGLGNLRNMIVAKDKLRLWPGEWVDEDATDNNDDTELS